MKDIAKNIRQLRCGKNMTQDELAEELFVTRQTVSNYENGKSRPDVEMLTRIAEVLDSDINALIYGPAPDVHKSERLRLSIAAGITVLLGLCCMLLTPILKKYAHQTFHVGWFWMMQMLVMPSFLLFAGWTLMHLLGMAVKWKPFDNQWAYRAALVLVVILIILAILTLWYTVAVVINGYLFDNHIRGEWIEDINLVNGTVDKGWRMLPPPVPDFVSRIVGWISYYITEKCPLLYSLLGAIIWYLGIPKRKEA